jgi:DNA helicase II / ATP-dependent DNA helicase PcrA
VSNPDAASEVDSVPGRRENASADLRELTSGLDADQQRAVLSSAPLLAVIAGAGSGKTSVLTRRVAVRFVQGTADPMHTAVITFTRQAAAELRRRLRALGLQDTIMAGTFHAISLSLLQQHWERIGRQPPTVVQDRRRLIGEVIGPRRTSLIEDLAIEIDWARARNLTARSYAQACAASGRVSNASPGDVERVMTDIEALKIKRGVIDLDDLLSHVIDTARKDEEFANILRWRIRHLYVDEAQDMNPLQRAVLDVWRSDRDDLTLVGDPSQAIYGFNGSDPTILRQLEDNFPGIEVVRLDTNYRCTPQIVRAGLSALAHLDTPPPPLHSARPDGSAVAIYGFDDETAEAQGVVRLLEGAHGPHDSWRQFAVLARTNAQLGPIRSALESASIPVRVNTSRSSDPLQRFVREVGDLPSRTRIAAWSRDAYLTNPFEHEESMSRDEVPSGTFEDAQKTYEALLRVARAVDEFLADGGSDGRSFLAWVRTQRPFDDASNFIGVDVMTIHAAKGREWDMVIITGCEDGILPHTSAKSAAAKDEEVRLAYVAMTRGADRLVLTYSKNRRGRRRSRSPLLDGIETTEPVAPPPPEFLEALRERRSHRARHDLVLDELTTWRLHAARVSGVDPRLICPDDVLADLARIRPDSIDALEAVPGLGMPLIVRAGPSILAAIALGITQESDAG